jgi:hypothetical protein
MEDSPHAQVVQYCRSTVSDETAGPNRFVCNRAGYRRLHAETRLEYFGLKVELYSHVAEQHARSVNLQ